MAERAALITGASSGIGLAVARVLGEEGYALTVSARRPDKLESAAEGLRADGLEVQSVAANMTDEDDVVGVFAKHREAYGRLDMLMNNAGVGIGAPMEEIQTKHLDMQLGVNLRALIIGTREGLPMLQAGRRRARQGADRQHRLDRRQGRPGLALDLRRDQGRGDQLHPVDPPRGRRRRHPVHGAGARASSTRR